MEEAVSFIFCLLCDLPLLPTRVFLTVRFWKVAQLLALDLASNCELLIEGDAATVDLKPETEVFQLPTPTGASDKVTPGAAMPVDTGERVLLQPPICCYTFGQPRVGNRAFSRLYKQRVPHTFRVATEGDPFTAMPHLMCCAGIYKHAGTS